MEIRDTKEIISRIKELVGSPGYIYALCLMIIDDFHYDLEKVHEIDHRNRLNRNEISLIIGLLIQSQICIEKPNSPFDLLKLKNSTYSLMKELHFSINKPMFEKFKNLDEKLNSDQLYSKKNFFGGEDIFVEPIFYSGDGLYDFQYLEYLDKKYKYDKDWLFENRKFVFQEIKEIANRIKFIHQEKIEKVIFFDLEDHKLKYKNILKKQKSIQKKDRKIYFEEFTTMMEFFRFYELFEIDNQDSTRFAPEKFSEIRWSTFYDELLDLLCMSSQDFDSHLDFSAFLKNFAIPPNSIALNEKFNNIGDFNLFTSRPLIGLQNGKYFIPLTFSVFEAVYESPYYWMLEDNNYSNKLAYNRGKVGEEITYELLEKVFGTHRVFKSVRIESKKGHDDTDIDILCVLGSKALCVQVKSKKLTHLSRKGSYQQLQKDFKGAVQNAYEQGLICCERIIEKTAVFYNSNGNLIELPEQIDEVYILGVTTENYPSLTHQTSIFLEKEPNTPFPLILTIFDLELVVFYLENPYDFLYYIRQRIQLMDHYYANEELHFLGYHLFNKLWKPLDSSLVYIDQSFGQLIDRNYLPFKLGLKTSDNGDKIKNKWKNDDFELLCKQITLSNSPKVTDIIFHLLDWTENARDNLMNTIKKVKSQTIIDNSWHSFSLMIGPERSAFGLTYISWSNNNPKELIKLLLKISKARKYKSKANLWIGLGCLKNSGNFVDVFVYNDQKWEYNESLEKEVKEMFKGKNKGTTKNFGHKIGRNNQCPCSSGLKYKHCCGKYC